MLGAVLFGLFILASSSSASAPCNFPPFLWCSSLEIASHCKVVDQCQEHFKKTPDANKVSLGLYVEALCPDCQEFIKNQLWPTWGKVHDIINLTVIPYGNAKEQWDGKEWQYSCQHGPDECKGNLIESCAIESVNYDAEKYFPFIYCLESSEDIPSASAAKCASKYQLDYSAIMACVNSNKGNVLEHEMALKTRALNPPHEYVPWVTLNGIHTEAIQMKASQHLLQLICDTYKGPPPPACAQKQEIQACKKN